MNIVTYNRLESFKAGLEKLKTLGLTEAADEILKEAEDCVWDLVDKEKQTLVVIDEKNWRKE